MIKISSFSSFDAAQERKAHLSLQSSRQILDEGGNDHFVVSENLGLDQDNEMDKVQVDEDGPLDEEKETTVTENEETAE